MKITWLKNRPSLAALSGVALSATLMASACSSGDNASPSDTFRELSTNTQTILASTSLDTVDSCSVLLEQIQEDALSRVGPYGLDQPGIRPLGDGSDGRSVRAGEDGAASPSTADMGDDGAASEPAEPKETSGTNNQEEGVDEADLIKSDGSTLAVISDGQLRVLDVTGDTPIPTQTISLHDLGHPTGMFLNEDRLVLLSVSYDQNGQPTSLMTDIDVENGSIGGSAEFDGQYISSREVGGSLRLVLSSDPVGIDFVYPDGRTDETQAEKENRQLIEESELKDWLPEYRVTGNSSPQASKPLVDCPNVHLPATFSGGGQVVVITVDIDQPLEISDSLSVHTDVQTVYASTERLVVAAPQWPDLSDPSDSGSFSSPVQTALHSFEIGDEGTTNYVASGPVRGLLLNQFSLSEYEGNLRVATTDQGQPVGWSRPLPEQAEPQPEPGSESESYVTVLSEEDGALVPLGQVGGLGRGEDIFAVRFIGDVGYVVTFRQIDPLYTVDLSDPSNPEILGELKIPGFSNYLHGVDERTLLGVGSDGTDDGQVLGAAVSLFDVEDLSDPTRLDKHAFEPGSATRVAHDAKAFTFWPETNTAIVPVESFGPETDLPDDTTGGGGYLSVAAVFDVDTEVGRLTLRGTIDHSNGCDQQASQPSERRIPREDDSDQPTPDPAPPEDEYGEPSPCQTPSISRTMVIGEDIYTFSNAGISVHGLEQLREKAWVSFN